MRGLLLLGLLFGDQTLERTIDLSGLGWGKLSRPLPVDTDGNPHTNEWVVQSAELPRLGQWRVVAERPGGLCIGEWFDPRESPASAITLVREGGRDKLLVSHGSAFDFGLGQRYDLIRLDTPACD
jgi:hypothetical protein